MQGDYQYLHRVIWGKELLSGEGGERIRVGFDFDSSECSAGRNDPWPPKSADDSLATDDGQMDAWSSFLWLDENSQRLHGKVVDSTAYLLVGAYLYLE